MADPLVLGASIEAKWFIRDAREADIDLADEILSACIVGDLVLHAPGVFTYEVCNLFAKACAQRTDGEPRLAENDAIASAQDLFALNIQIAPRTPEEAADAIKMAVGSSKRFYDMTYVRLAQSLDCRWCTADEKILRGSAPGFPVDRVELLASRRSKADI